MRHTPGPWKVVNAGPHWNNKATDNYQIQYGEDGECISDHVYEPADAQLISAAPELLAALKLTASILSGDDVTKGATYQGTGNGKRRKSTCRYK